MVYCSIDQILITHFQLIQHILLNKYVHKMLPLILPILQDFDMKIIKLNNMQMFVVLFNS